MDRHRYVPSNIDGTEALYQLDGLFLETTSCGCKVAMISIDWLADKHGWDKSLSSTVNALRCSKCGNRPHIIHLANDSQSGSAESKTKMRTALMHLISPKASE